MHHRSSALALLLLGLSLCVASCAVDRTPTPQTPLQQGAALWAQDGVNAYRIVVATISIWHMQVHDITVRDGRVVASSATCEPAPTELGKCAVQPFDAEEYTVPGLFARARSLASSRDAQFGKMEFDPTYGYPVLLSFNDPDLIDEEWGWRVQEFEVLE